MGIIFTIFYWSKHGTMQAQIQGEGKSIPPLKRRNYWYMHNVSIGDDNLQK